ncbi:MAG TPA: type II secretion system protein N [Nevskiales bacterium]|nr:type II secretion system protein N [Nevskiales bacterium]
MNRLYLGAGIAGLLFCLLALTPAPLLYHWLRDDWGAQVQAFGLSGNLWRGQAASLNLSGIVLQSVEWRWRPQALLLGRISHRISAQTAGGSVQAVVSSPLLGKTLRLRSLKGSLPVEQIGPALRLPVLPFTGTLQFELQRLQLRQGKPWLAEGVLEFRNLVFSFSTPPATLGDYRAELSTAQQAIQIALSSAGGQLEAGGSGQITREGQYLLEIKLRPRATAPPAVLSLLQPLGRPDAEGWYRLRRNGSF